MKLIYIKPSKSKGYLLLGMQEEEAGEKCSFVISEDDYSAIGSPAVGDEIFGMPLSVIKAADERYRATLAALRILEYGDNSKKNLYAKLKARSFSSEVCEDVVCEMVRLGYINEENQLLRLVKREADNLAGPRKIYARLLSRGFSYADVSSAITTLSQSGEIDFEASKALLIEKKLTRDATDEEIRALLYKFGY